LHFLGLKKTKNLGFSEPTSSPDVVHRASVHVFWRQIANNTHCLLTYQRISDAEVGFEISSSHFHENVRKKSKSSISVMSGTLFTQIVGFRLGVSCSWDFSVVCRGFVTCVWRRGRLYSSHQYHL